MFLVLLLSAFLLKGIAFAVMLPPWQGPDEGSNLAAQARMLETNPEREDRTVQAIVDSEKENHFWQLRAWSKDFSRVISSPSSGERPSETFSIYYWVTAPAYFAGSTRGALGSMYAVRLLSILFGAATVLFTFLASREFRSLGSALPLLSSSAVAFVPQFGFITSVVNKDSLACAIGGATIWLLCRIPREGPNKSMVLAVTGLLIAGYLTKPTFVAFVPAAVIVLVASILSGRHLSRRALMARALGLGAAATATLAALVILAVSRPTRFTPYGEGLSRINPSKVIDAITQPREWIYILSQSWGDFGWLNQPLNKSLYVLLFSLTGLSVVGLMIWLIRRRRRAISHDRHETIIFIGLCTGIVAFAFVHVLALLTFGNSQARSWFPVIGAFGTLFALGLSELAPFLKTRLAVWLWINSWAVMNVAILLRQFPDRYVG